MLPVGGHCAGRSTEKAGDEVLRPVVQALLLDALPIEHEARARSWVAPRAGFAKKVGRCRVQHCDPRPLVLEQKLMRRLRDGVHVQLHAQRLPGGGCLP